MILVELLSPVTGCELFGRRLAGGFLLCLLAAGGGLSYSPPSGFDLSHLSGLGRTLRFSRALVRATPLGPEFRICAAPARL